MSAVTLLTQFATFLVRDSRVVAGRVVTIAWDDVSPSGPGAGRRSASSTPGTQPLRPIAAGRPAAGAGRTLGEFWALGTLLAIVRPQTRPKSPNAPRLRTRARQPPVRPVRHPPLQSAGFDWPTPNWPAHQSERMARAKLDLSSDTYPGAAGFTPLLGLRPRRASAPPPRVGGCHPQTAASSARSTYWIESAAPPGVDAQMFAGAAEMAQPHLEQ